MSQYPTSTPPNEGGHTPHLTGVGGHDDPSHDPFQPAATSLVPGTPRASDSTTAGRDVTDVTDAAAATVAETADTAKQEVAAVASDVKEHTQDVAGHAADETKAVVAEGLEHAKALFLQSRSEMAAQASAQQEKVAGSLRSLVDELEQMLSGTQQQGIASQAVSTLSGHAQTAADFLEQRDFNGVIDEVTSFARRRPGAFLLGAALAGLVAGRMTRGLAADSGQPSGPSTGSRSTAGFAADDGMPRAATQRDAMPPAVVDRDGDRL